MKTNSPILVLLFFILNTPLCQAQEVFIENFTAHELGLGAVEQYNAEELIREVAALSKEINLNPNLSELYVKRASAKLNLGDHRGAVSDYNKALDLKPNEARLFAERAKARVYMGDYKTAVVDYSRAIEINPELPNAHLHRAYAKKQLGDHRGAKADFAKERALRPADESAYLDGMEAYYSGRYEEAVAHFDVAISLNLSNPEFYYQRGKSQAMLGNFREAAKDFGESLKQQPRDVAAIVQRAMAYLHLDERDAACLDLSRAGELGYDRAYVLIREHCGVD